MIPAVNTLKNYAPFIFTGGGIAMLSNTLAFDVFKFLAREPAKENVKGLVITEGKPREIDQKDKLTPYEKFIGSLILAAQIGLIAAVASNVLLFSSRVILSLSLKEKHFAFLNLVSRNISNRVPDTNVICAYLSILIKACSIASTMIASDFFEEDKDKTFSTIGLESVARVSSIVLSGAVGAVGSILIQKYLPEA